MPPRRARGPAAGPGHCHPEDGRLLLPAVCVTRGPGTATRTKLPFWRYVPVQSCLALADCLLVVEDDLSFELCRGGAGVVSELCVDVFEKFSSRCQELVPAVLADDGGIDGPVIRNVMF